MPAKDLSTSWDSETFVGTLSPVILSRDDSILVSLYAVHFDQFTEKKNNLVVSYECRRWLIYNYTE